MKIEVSELITLPAEHNGVTYQARIRPGTWTVSSDLEGAPVNAYRRVLSQEFYDANKDKLGAPKEAEPKTKKERHVEVRSK